VVLILAESEGFLYKRVHKAITSFDKVKIYLIPENEEEQHSAYDQLLDDLKNKRRLFQESFKLIYEEFKEVLECSATSECSKIAVDELFIRKQKNI